MTKFIAMFGLMVTQFMISLANYWYTFGMWPRSWASYALCFSATFLVAMLQMVIAKEKS